MRLFSYGDGGQSIGVVVEEGVAVDVSEVVGRGGPGELSPMRRLVAGFDSYRMAIDGVLNSGPRISLDDLELTAPVPDPSKVIAAPVNYVDHMEEMHQESHIDALGVFLKAPSSVIGANGTIRLPYSDRRFDQEGELALVMGRVAHNVPVDDALSYVFGYTCLLDITMRGGEDRSTRKSFDTFTPIGPYLVTPDEVGELGSLELRCSVSGEERQRVMIADLIWDVPALISYVSSVMTMFPGDVITTGTPKGVGPLEEGDRVTVEISRVGSLSVDVRADGAVLSPTKGANRGPVPPPPIARPK